MLYEISGSHCHILISIPPLAIKLGFLVRGEEGMLCPELPTGRVTLKSSDRVLLKALSRQKSKDCNLEQMLIPVKMKQCTFQRSNGHPWVQVADWSP